MRKAAALVFLLIGSTVAQTPISDQEFTALLRSDFECRTIYRDAHGAIVDYGKWADGYCDAAIARASLVYHKIKVRGVAKTVSVSVEVRSR